MDWENRRKDGRGFYKLNEESIAAVREDLAQDYRTLADQHSEELAQLLDDFGESQEDLFHQIMQAGSTRTNEESIAIPIPDTAEQEEPQPMSPEITATVDSTERQAEPPAIPESETADQEEPQPHSPEPTPRRKLWTRRNLDLLRARRRLKQPQ